MEGESAVLRCDFWLERGREDAVVCGRENHTSNKWFLCVFVGNRDELGWNSEDAW